MRSKAIQKVCMKDVFIRNGKLVEVMAPAGPEPRGVVVEAEEAAKIIALGGTALMPAAFEITELEELLLNSGILSWRALQKE